MTQEDDKLKPPEKTTADLLYSAAEAGSQCLEKRWGKLLAALCRFLLLRSIAYCGLLRLRGNWRIGEFKSAGISRAYLSARKQEPSTSSAETKNLGTA